MPEDPFALRAEGIGKSFRLKEVLKSASLWAAEGKVTTLMGRNGSGKTTLMRIAAGDLRPDRGRVALDGQTIRRPRLARLARRGLMYVPQNHLGAPHLKVKAHLGVTSGHDVRPLLAISDAVVWSVAGTTHHLGTPEEAVRHHQFRREYLGPGFEA